MSAYGAVMLLPCRTQMKLSFRFKHGTSTPFETIRRGTAELGSTQLLSTATFPCHTAVAQLTFKQRAIVVLNSIHKYMYFALFSYITAGWMVYFCLLNLVQLYYVSRLKPMTCYHRATAELNAFEFGTAVAQRL